MARKLPWAVSERESSSKRRRIEQSTQVKQDDLHPPASPQDQDVITQNHDRARSITKSDRDIKRPRTPSTSPARGPPPQESMHDGFQADDIYMMVEDEFQTVAQSYTAHLHQAEYKRLMREARNKPSKPLPEPASPMSKTAKSRLKSVILQKKQKDALRQVMGTDLQDQEDTDDVVDLWSGTSLAQFMSSNSQGKTSLIGLERISSTTKAGSGFARADTNQSRLQHEPRKQSTTSSALSITHRLKHDHDSSHPHPSSSLSVPAQPGASTSRSHRINSKDTTKTSLYLSNGDDDLFINRRQSGDESIRGSRLNRGDARKAQNGKSSIQEKEADRKARLAQVPMFMI